MNDSTEFTRDRGVWIVAAAALCALFIYQLVFVQSAFIELAREEGAGQRQLSFLRMVMAVSGVAGGLLAGWRFRFDRYPRVLAHAFRGCGIAAVLTLLAGSWGFLVFSAAVTGLAFGWLLVTLIAGLRSCVGTPRLGLCLGVGIGLAAAVANLPWLAGADATMRTVVATVLMALAGVTMPWLLPQEPSVSRTADYRTGGMAAITAAFVALVWLGSASEFVIRTAETAAGEGAGSWTRAAAHLAAGLLGGWVLDRGWLARTVLGGFVLLSLAGLLLLTNPIQAETAGVLHAGGITLVMVALLCHPARGGRVWYTAVFTGITWWIAPMLGLGMAEELNQVPWPFVIATGVVVGGALVWRERERRRTDSPPRSQE